MMSKFHFFAVPGMKPVDSLPSFSKFLFNISIPFEQCSKPGLVGFYKGLKLYPVFLGLFHKPL